MSFSLKPHVYKQKDGVSTLVKVQPYVRLCAEGGPPIYIQHGSFWTESGKAIDEADLPEWADAAIAKLNDRVRTEVGL